MYPILSRAGFVARAVIYGIIGLLAFDLVIGHGGKITNQQGALRTVEQHPFGNVLLAALAVGLGGYSLWRFFRAALGHGREGADRGIERIGALGSGIVYALICAVAVQILVGSGGSSSESTKQTASDVFAWPGGRWLIGIAGLVMLGVGAPVHPRLEKKFWTTPRPRERDRSQAAARFSDGRPRRARHRLLPRQDLLVRRPTTTRRTRRSAGRGSREALRRCMRVVAPRRSRRQADRVRVLLAGRSALPADLGSPWPQKRTPGLVLRPLLRYAGSKVPRSG
jgi:hypothetical protein